MLTLSWSKLKLAFRCPYAYYNNVILGRPMRKRLPTVVGATVHQSVQKNLTQKAISGQMLSLPEIEDFTVTRFREIMDEEEVDTSAADEPMTVQDAEREAINLSSLHADQLAPKIDPFNNGNIIGVELPIVVCIPDLPFRLSVVIDVLESDKFIRDLKTVSRRPPSHASLTDDQLTLYAFAAWLFYRDGGGRVERPEEIQVGFDVLVRGTRPRAFDARSTAANRSLDDFNVILHRFQALYEMIEKGVFPPAGSDSWFCSPKWCPFTEDCKYFRKTVSVALGGEF